MTRRFHIRADLCGLLLAACLLLIRTSASADGGLSTLAVVDVGFAPVNLALSEDGQRLYVAGGDNGKLGIVNTASLALTSVWQLDGGVQWSSPSSDDRFLYIARGLRLGPHEFQVISARDGTLLTSISTNLRLSRPVVDTATDRILMTGNQADTGSISVPHVLVVSQSTQQLVEQKFIGINGSMSVGKLVQDRCRPLFYTAQSVLGWTTSVRARDSQSLYYVSGRPTLPGTSYQGNLNSTMTGLAVDGIRDRAIVVWADYSYRDPAGRHGRARILGSDDWVQLPQGGSTAIDERTGIAYVAGYEPNSQYRTDKPDTLIALDLDANRIIGSVEIGHSPHDLVIDSQTSRVYVSNAGDSTVSVIQGIRPADGTPEPTCPPAS